MQTKETHEGEKTLSKGKDRKVFKTEGCQILLQDEDQVFIV